MAHESRDSRVGRILTLLIFVLSVSAASSLAEGVEQWRTPDGQLHLGGDPPEGSTRIGVGSDWGGTGGSETVAEIENARDSAEDRLSIEATLHRREIERRLQRAAADLEAIRAERDAVEETRIEGRNYELATEEDVAEAANFQLEKARRLSVLDERERGKLGEIEAAWREFEALDARVRSRNGGNAPTWWRDRLACSKCPAR